MNNQLAMAAFTGIWDITDMEAWTVEPDWIIGVAGNGSGTFQFLYIEAEMDCRLDIGNDNRIEFTFYGNDECDETFGSRLHGETLQGYLHFHQGETSRFTAKKRTKSVC